MRVERGGGDIREMAGGLMYCCNGKGEEQLNCHTGGGGEE